MKVSEFNECVTLHQQSIYRFVYRMVNDLDDTKDIVQETFVKLWEQGGDIHKTKVKSWLFTTSYRLTLAYFRKSKTRSDFDLEDISKAVEENYDNFDLKGIINQSLLLLSELQKSVLMLKDYEGYAYNEIANILEISEDSVKVHLFRARKKIKEHIKDLKLVL